MPRSSANSQGPDLKAAKDGYLLQALGEMRARGWVVCAWRPEEVADQVCPDGAKRKDVATARKWLEQNGIAWHGTMVAAAERLIGCTLEVE